MVVNVLYTHTHTHTHKDTHTHTHTDTCTNKHRSHIKNTNLIVEDGYESKMLILIIEQRASSHSVIMTSFRGK